MTDHQDPTPRETPDVPPSPDPSPDPGPDALSSPEPPREGTFHAGPGPRLRRAGRTAAIVAILGFVALLTFLTARYSHDFGGPRGEEEAKASPLASVPLSAERIREFARRKLEEELRAAEPAPGPPEPRQIRPGAAGEPGSGAPAAPVPSYAAPSRPPAAPSPAREELSALRSPLSPRGARGASSSPSPAPSAGPAGVDVPELPELPEFPGVPGFSSWPSAGGASGSVAGRASGAPIRGGAREILAAPEPLDRRAFEGPEDSLFRLEREPRPEAPTLYAGTAVPLVLTHDVATDVPGPVRAVVARDVFDSVSRERLVIPRGSLVLGRQAAHAASGDERILLHWRAVKLPSGESYRLPVLPAGSRDGTAGVRGRVDHHWWSRVGSAVALSLVGAGVQLSQPQERTAVRGFAPSEGQVVGRELGRELGRLSREVLRRGVARPPTIHLRAGERMTLLLTRDLAFPR